MNLQKRLKQIGQILTVALFSIMQLFGQSSFFVENKGQVFDQNGVFNQEVSFVLSLNEYNVSFYKDHFCYEVFQAKREDSININVDRIEVWFENVNPAIKIESRDVTKEVLNVFKNGKSITDINIFESIYYKNVWEGVDIEFLVSENKLKYNYIVRNQSLKTLNLKIKGAKVISNKVDAISFKSKNGEIKEAIPKSYFLNNSGESIEEIIRINTAKNRIQYVLPQNRTSTFIIDPIAYGNEYTTYYGGANIDLAHSINTQKNNNVIISGYTVSTNNIATTGSYQTTISDRDVFIAAFDDQGSRLWGTYFGGTDYDRSYSAKIDSNDNIFISGGTSSLTGISTPGAFQQYLSSADDAFIAKFTSNGILVWGSYYGGNAHELITEIAIDDFNKIYVTGHTASSDLQCTPNAYRNALSGFENAFLGVFDNNGNVIYNSYYIKGSNTRGEAIEVMKNGTIYLAGYTNDTEVINSSTIHQAQNGGYLDGFIMKLNSNFQLIWKTYLGGDHNDLISAMTIDSLENIYVVGKTKSVVGVATNNSFQPNYQSDWDGFVVKIDSACTRQWGTYIQAGNSEELNSIQAKDSTIWVLGMTNGYSFPISPSAIQTTNKGGLDNLIINMSNTGGLVWSSYFGGLGDELGQELKLTKNNKILIVGLTGSSAHVATTGAHQTTYGGSLYDGFWTKLCKPIHPTVLSQVGAVVVCEGDSIGVSATNSFNQYLWSNGKTTTSIYASTSGNYVLKTKDANNCPGRSDTLTVTVIPKPTLIIQKSKNAICHEDSVLLSVNGSYSSYLWSNGKTTSSIYISDEQAYSLTVTNTYGCIYQSDTVQLSFAQYQYPIQIVGDTIICTGGSSVLYRNGLNTINWNTAQNSNSIIVTASGDYWFTGIGLFGCPVVSDTVTITEVSYNSPALVLDTLSLFSICSNDSIQLTAENNFNSYLWSNGAVSQSVTLKIADYYYVSATDSNGCVGVSDSVKLVVNSLPNIEIIPHLDTVCIEDTVFLNSSIELDSYLWSTNSISDSIMFKPISSGNFSISLIGIDSNNCSNGDSIEFIVLDCLVFNSVEEKDELFTVFNNRNLIEIESNHRIEDIKIYDLNGRLVLEKNQINAKNYSINTESLAKAVYVLELKIKDVNKLIRRKVSLF